MQQSRGRGPTTSVPAFTGTRSPRTRPHVSETGLIMNCIRFVLRPIVVSRHVARVLALGTIALLSVVTADLPAQRTRQGADSVPLRADYRDIGELLAKLPKVAPPAFNESDGVELGAIQLSCLDRLQPLHPPRAQERGE